MPIKLVSKELGCEKVHGFHGRQFALQLIFRFLAGRPACYLSVRELTYKRWVMYASFSAIMSSAYTKPSGSWDNTLSGILLIPDTPFGNFKCLSSRNKTWASTAEKYIQDTLTTGDTVGRDEHCRAVE